ncbi:MAG: hypothetical protein ABI668_12155 [Sphingorhabdus sp.]
MNISQKPSWHFWAISVVSLLWNAMGVLDYTLTHTRNPAYMANFGPEELAYFYDFPAWATAFWALGVWAAILGSIFLLLRKSWAVVAFAVSIIGLIGTSFYQFSHDMPDSFKTPGMIAFTIAIWVVTLLLYGYARRMRAQGILN